MRSPPEESWLGLHAQEIDGLGDALLLVNSDIMLLRGDADKILRLAGTRKWVEE